MGNVRELRNWVEATLALGEAPALFAQAEAAMCENANCICSPQLMALSYKDARNAVLDRFEHSYLTSILETTRNNVAQAARKARMDRSYLIKLLQKHGFRNTRESYAPDSDALNE